MFLKIFDLLYKYLIKNFMKLNYFKKNTGFLIRIDDVAQNMNWKMMDKCEILFDKYQIKPLIGVIPNNQDRELMKFENKQNFWQKVNGWKKKGWEISMHGYMHKYESNTFKKDYFAYGGLSEFFGQPYKVQKDKIESGIKIFKDNGINIKSFFAPNHTYDKNTFIALKNSGIETVVDGYGLIPYSKYGLRFIPQLFYKLIFLPFGIQSSQIHLNDWKDNDFIDFEKFIEKNKEKIINVDDSINRISDNYFSKIINLCVALIIKFIRKAR